jgi:hypothetical protein
VSHWYYNTSSGAMQHVSIPFIGQLTSLFPQITGWHELHISGDATLLQAEAEARREFPNAAPPTTNVKKALGQQTSSETGIPLTGLAAIGDFFHKITLPQTWTRVAEVGVGGILLYAGLRALGHQTSPNVATKHAVRPVRKVARTTAKVVVPEARLAGRVAAKRAAPKTTARVAAHRAQVRKYGARRPS